jgi:hypothetical protein
LLSLKLEQYTRCLLTIVITNRFAVRGIQQIISKATRRRPVGWRVDELLEEILVLPGKVVFVWLALITPSNVGSGRRAKSWRATPLEGFAGALAPP